MVNEDQNNNNLKYDIPCKCVNLIGIKCICDGYNLCPPVQCRSCNGVKYSAENTQRLIQKQARICSSQYTSALASMNILDNRNPLSLYFNLNWHQMSDRIQPSNQLIHYPGNRGNSTKTSITRMRPGSLSPGGLGVDIKHNSYDRYLGRLKSKNLKQQNPTGLNPIKGNKTFKMGLISGCRC